MQSNSSSFLRNQNFRQLAKDLSKFGVIVIPVFANNSARQKWEDRVWAALDDMPEYKVKGKTAQRVLGGFGALGNPSSFHHPVIQDLRTKLKTIISRPLFRALVEELRLHPDTRLEMLFDRVCIRYKEFGAVSAETWHRDIYDGPKFGHRSLPKTLNNGRGYDEILGGWVNLSDRPTYFKAIAKSHQGEDARRAQQKGGGFSQLSESQIRKEKVDERLTSQAGKRIGSVTANIDGSIIVPSGHQVIFFQRLLHAVASGPGPSIPQLRLFVGHRLTQERTPLFNLERVIQTSAVPRIPSGQIPPMFSQNHYAFFQKPNKYQRWGESTFKSVCLFKRETTSGNVYYTPGSQYNINVDANRKRYMPSLASMGFEPYSYSALNFSTMTPELFVRE